VKLVSVMTIKNRKSVIVLIKLTVA
jgi:hypothetical protein